MLSKKGFTPLEIKRGRKFTAMKKTKKFLTGFTLIELLVVIAIIGILASIVLVSFPSATNKAKDARIISSMSQARSLAMEFYTTGNTYTGYTINATLLADITAKAGAAPTTLINANGQAYCIASTLNSGGYYCADSAGLIGKTVSPLTVCVATCALANTCACPAGTTI